MKAMIMAAGVGSRLMPLTSNVPKPMVPIANKPVMEHAVNLLKSYGVIDIVANLHYLPHKIKDHFGDGSAFGVNLHFSEEKKLLGTAGGVKSNGNFLNETFIVLSGDGLTDINLKELVAFHKKKKSMATIALKQVDEVEQFGIVITDREGKIKKFQEKPRKEEAENNLANTGIYVFEPEIFEYIPKNEFFDFGKQLFPLLVEMNMPFYGFKMNGYWCDIGNLEAYRQANFDVLNGQIRLPLDNEEKAYIHSSARITEKVLIGTGTTIGKDVEFIGNCIIGANCKIGDRSIIQNAVLWDGVRTEAEVVLNECLIGQDCLLEKGAIIGRKSALSDGCVVGTKAEVLSHKSLESGKVIPKYSVAG